MAISVKPVAVGVVGVVNRQGYFPRGYVFVFAVAETNLPVANVKDVELRCATPIVFGQVAVDVCFATR